MTDYPKTAAKTGKLCPDCGIALIQNRSKRCRSCSQRIDVNEAYITSRITATHLGYETPCWLWNGSIDKNGYARCNVSGEKFPYRIAYRLWKGDMPAGLEPDHLCGVRACCNPDHLEAVTHRENVMRSASFMARQTAMTHCKRGHEFTPENTIVTSTGSRRCRECNKAHQIAYNKRRSLRPS